MKTLRSSLVLITALAAIAESAYGQQPPDVVVSDPNNNTAMGTSALLSIGRAATNNTASGFQALYGNEYGSNNTASGSLTLEVNYSGNDNTAFGAYALQANTAGNGNTASGFQALRSNSIGMDNTATGTNTLFNNDTGNYNTASGVETLFSNTSGYYNTAYGYDALASNTTGNNNIAVGFQAGFNRTTGGNNIDIGSPGVAGEANSIRIGARGTQKATFIAGIYGTPVSGNAVMVSATGKLGVAVSSERYKTAVAPMGSDTAKLEQLRPVSFHLKSEPHGALQYGLIAEEVAKVYPELVIRNESGRIDGVRYDELAPMLLNEVQQQQTKMAAQDQHSAAQDAKISQLTAELAEMHAALVKLQSKTELVAQR